MESPTERDPPAPPGRPRGRPLSCAELVEAICSASVPLREARRVHLKAYGTLIPHLFMGDVLSRLGECLILGTAHALATNGGEVKGILEAIEQGMEQGDRETRNVIAISFVRDAEVELFFDDLGPLLGRATRAQMRGR